MSELVAEHGTENGAAEALGLPYTTLRRALRPHENTAKSGTWSKRLDQIDQARKEREASPAQPVALSVQENGGIVPAGYTRIPEVVIEPSAAEVWDVGTDEDVEPEEVPGDVLLPDWYIRSEYGVSPERIRHVRVRGDSMTPTISPGQRLVVALLAAGSVLRDGLIYILAGPGGAQVKRLLLEPGHVHVWSDNPDRPRYRVALDQFDHEYRVVAVVLEANIKL